ncbi:hypothetical protein CASFOL_011150 [Castilleja foliolosa]|uniref:NAC domain-containing protein n=1 Tax=Castilleja foliolosa TaxID=1961234 RepID=A0ABD3DYN7_9LAMI
MELNRPPVLPPGFYFHPTDEELVVHYLMKKVAAAPLPVDIIAEVDLYKFNPWEFPENAVYGDGEWYFFTLRCEKIILSGDGTQRLGVKKTMAFYERKWPVGVKSDWSMHEYRLADKPLNYCSGNRKRFYFMPSIQKSKNSKQQRGAAPPLPPESDGGNQNEMAPQLPDDHM